MSALRFVRSLAASLYGFRKGRTRAYPQYDVFLSFGPTRTIFTEVPYNALVAAGQRVFRDDARPVGEQIGPEDFRAMRTCRILIPVISHPYTKSKCCLRELTEIMDCRKHGKSVFPVFYGVNADALGRRGSNFEEALRECKREEVQKWAKALCSVSGIRGVIADVDGYGEKQLVEMVVASVSRGLETVRFETYLSIPWLRYFSEKKRRESKFQVFLAFCAPDARYNLAAYLHTALAATGFEVLNADDPSPLSEDVGEICNAIGHCKISIPILSENFAASRWCLEDLAQMLDCKRTKGQKILPIFYEVEPSHVRDVSHLFGEHMLRHKEWVDESTYERWEGALREVASWESGKTAYGHESALVEAVVKEVSMLLNIC